MNCLFMLIESTNEGPIVRAVAPLAFCMRYAKKRPNSMIVPKNTRPDAVTPKGRGLKSTWPTEKMEARDMDFYRYCCGGNTATA